MRDVADEISVIKRMAARLIFRALLDFVHYQKWSNGRRPKNKVDRRNKETFEDAKLWLFEPTPCAEFDGLIETEDFMSQLEAQRLLETFDQTMSFETSCAILGWNPEWVRRRIPRLTAEALRRVGKKHGFL
jgi:hypothetical protein